MQLRPYQAKIVESVDAGWESFSKQLVVVPTGGGKTIIFSKLALAEQERGGRTLILAHREELIDQAIEKLHRSTGIMAQKEKAEHSASLHASVVVASVQSMMRRLAKWPADHFGLVVADEAHHCISDSWQTVLRHFDNEANVLGVTATPDRGDRKNLGKYFENVAAEVGLFSLINEGYLSRIAVRSVPLEIYLNGVRQTAGDYNDADLGDALAPYLGAIARAIRDHASFRRTLAFLPLRATSRAFVEACQAEGLSACHIDGDSPDRREILQRFAAGEFDVLSNAMLLTEGFDDPGIDCVVVLRPTRSRSLYAQMIGRGTRISEFKENLLLLDFLWMHEKHSLMRPANLIARTDEEAEQITMRLMEGKGGDGAEDLEEASNDAKSEREEKLREELEEKSKRRGKFINPDEFAMMLGESSVAEYAPEMKWEERPLTDGQRGVLERNGFDIQEIRGRGHASKVIDLIIRRSHLNLCTPKQMRMLKRFGVQEAENFSFAKASALIDARMNRGRPVGA